MRNIFTYRYGILSRHITESKKEIPEQYLKCNPICVNKQTKITLRISSGLIHTYANIQKKRSPEGIFQTTKRLPLGNTEIIEMGEGTTGVFKISTMF